MIVSVALSLDLVQRLANFRRGELLGLPVGVGGRCLFAGFIHMVLVLKSDGGQSHVAVLMLRWVWLL